MSAETIFLKHQLFSYAAALMAITIICWTIWSVAKGEVPALDLKRGFGVREKYPAINAEKEPKKFWSNIAFNAFVGAGLALLAVLNYHA